MKQLVQGLGSRRLEVIEAPDPRVMPGRVLVCTSHSLVSAGTERALVELGQKSLLGKALARPVEVRKVLDKVRQEGLLQTLDKIRGKLGTSLPLGYSCSGTVLGVGQGVSGFTVGDQVACAGFGYAVHAEVVSVPQNLVVSVPPEVPLDGAAFVTVGAIAMHGVRSAAPAIGEWVAVIGMGLLGQLAARILIAAGCVPIMIDTSEQRVARAAALGAGVALVRSGDVHERVSAFTRGAGVDRVLITASSTSSDPIELAAQLAADRATVVVVGDVGMQVPRKSFYEKELTLLVSRSYGPGRYDPRYEEGGIDYPRGYVRWTERRNMEAFVSLLAARAVTTGDLVTHRFGIDDAPRAFDAIADQASLAVLIDYAGSAAIPKPMVRFADPQVPAPRHPRIGIIGAGQFARSVLLPALRRHGSRFGGVATRTGISAVEVARQFNCTYATSDPERILDDPDIDAVLIATRHDTHAGLTEAGLKRGKAVFVEKPLAIDPEGLRGVMEALTVSSHLHVGFNRRFSPFIQRARRLLAHRGPISVVYRINAGSLPAAHWLRNPAEGGGRVIGEVCHFVDTLQFLTGAVPMRVFASRLRNGGVDAKDSVSIWIEFQDGSLGAIHYVAVGAPSMPKERVEAFAGGFSVVIDDYRRMEAYEGARTRVWRSRWRQAKGFGEEVAAFLAAVEGRSMMPIPAESLILTTETCFAIERSLECGAAVDLSPPAA